MKRYNLLLIAILIVFFSCKKDQNEDPSSSDNLVVLKQQWGFALNYTAAWCGPCGNWGAPLIHQFAEAGNVVAVTAHASGDPMYNQALYSSFENVRTDGGGIPAFWVGDKKSTNMSDMTVLLAQTPKAGIAIQSSMNENTMTVKAKIQFFETDPGDYYLSILILESGIDGSSSSGEYAQNGTSNPDSYKHDFVLRASSQTGNAYGEIITTDPAAGFSIDKEYTLNISTSWTNVVYPVAILWRKNPEGIPKYEFVNAVK